MQHRSFLEKNFALKKLGYRYFLFSVHMDPDISCVHKAPVYYRETVPKNTTLIGLAFQTAFKYGVQHSQRSMLDPDISSVHKVPLSSRETLPNHLDRLSFSNCFFKSGVQHSQRTFNAGSRFSVYMKYRYLLVRQSH